jgi:hypothetical protein
VDPADGDPERPRSVEQDATVNTTANMTGAMSER